ncbi:MAG: 2-amino-3,7-dideoxy-D-threo-hept-6-ulosonate synthase [Ignavibacteriales bacterium]
MLGASGKTLRMKRIFNERTEKSLIIPLDHGVTMGPLKGIVDVKPMVDMVLSNGANGVVLHKGLARHSIPVIKANNALIIHMSASTDIGKHTPDKVTVCSVWHAVRLGADAVSVHINFGSETEPRQIEDMAKIAEECEIYGIPLLVMAYARGESINELDPETVAHAVRVAVELGADIVKCNYTGTVESFQQVTQACQVPILIAGGPSINSTCDLFKMVANALAAGAAGVSIGRNIFEFTRPDLMIRQLFKIVHHGVDPVEAAEELENLMYGISGSNRVLTLK